MCKFIKKFKIMIYLIALGALCTLDSGAAEQTSPLITPALGDSMAQVMALQETQGFLGEEESSLVALRLALSPKSETLVVHNSHKVYEFAVGRGVVRVYANLVGQIFAYTGHGLRNHPHPLLFGPYLNEFQAEERNSHKIGRHALSIHTPNIQVGIWGPQGNLHWYLSLQNLPSGVTQDDIQ